jgi:hypothetical protein
MAVHNPTNAVAPLFFITANYFRGFIPPLVSHPTPHIFFAIYNHLWMIFVFFSSILYTCGHNDCHVLWDKEPKKRCSNIQVCLPLNTKQIPYRWQRDELCYQQHVTFRSPTPLQWREASNVPAPYHQIASPWKQLHSHISHIHIGCLANKLVTINSLVKLY